MRKSHAPSQRTYSSAANVFNKISRTPTCRENNEYNRANGQSEKDKSSFGSAEEASVRVFNAVYGKQSTKKHKTWEGDGLVEIGVKTVTLKDLDGKVMGRVSHKKTDELQEGSRLFIGNKEVEIVDLVVKQTSIKREPSPVINGDVQSLKKVKLETDTDEKKTALVEVSNRSVTNEFRSKAFIAPVKMNDTFLSYTPLILPSPSEEHQWEYNEKHLPVNEIRVEGSLAKVLRDHQRDGVTFLYNCITGIRNTNYMGCILADEMGLGKTLQCITVIWTLLNQGLYGKESLLKKVLIVVPSSLVKNWKNEFVRWIGSYRLLIFAVDKDHRIEDYARNPSAPVVIISYEMIVRGCEVIKSLTFDLIVCDEGHRLKNCNIKATLVLNNLNCKRRILLTGTPIQNDLQEFYTLFNFVNPGFLGTLPEFKLNFEQPIEASKEPTADEEMVATGNQKAKELTQSTKNFILRRTQSVIGSYLPSKNEYVVFCALSKLQEKLYKTVVDYWFESCHRDDTLGFGKSLDHFSVINILRKICNHPLILLNSEIDMPSMKGHLLDLITPLNQQLKEAAYVSGSSKLKVIEDILKTCSRCKEKIILVSNFTQTLDLLEEYCQSKGFSYVRFDGSTPVSKRNTIVSNFNSSSSLTWIMLLSSKAGGVGLNLVGAARLVLIDSDWNPANDLQAMARIWREGQKHSVHIYRLLMSGTVEEKIFQRQLKKAGLSESVVDPKSISNVKFSTEELKDLFSYESEVLCSTHQVLGCQCPGLGGVPGLPDAMSSATSVVSGECDTEDPSDTRRDCQIMFPSKRKNQTDQCVKNMSLENPEDDLSFTDLSIDFENSDPFASLSFEKRDCEILLSSTKSSSTPSLRMNQLFFWEHHSKPLGQNTLKALGLSDTGHVINYLFSNCSNN